MKWHSCKQNHCMLRLFTSVYNPSQILLIFLNHPFRYGLLKVFLTAGDGVKRVRKKLLHWCFGKFTLSRMSTVCCNIHQWKQLELLDSHVLWLPLYHVYSIMIKQFGKHPISILIVFPQRHLGTPSQILSCFSSGNWGCKPCPHTEVKLMW